MIFLILVGFEISIKETVNQISKLMNVEVEILKEEKRLRPLNSEVRRLVGSNLKLKKATGWNPPKWIKFIDKWFKKL